MKTKIYLIALTVLLSFTALTSRASVNTDALTPLSKETIATMTDEQKQARIEEIKARVNEIKAMKKSDLTKEERKELRTELKGLKHEANAMGGGGIYLSVGAIIIIILVLILIL
ncbi:hypothetical protein SAMN05216464_10637 [Mucilaginibacter pineti]|jgi:hypothetical protein|uniref:Seryl-tRNA synthetase n=1 Tax=Mucilaginibacter pineti TaxID=1391627 RepID=A0A1G7CP23_9SPHI|nr:hypothetical protein [Mucilaginibacter pineti]SDE41164.1 hypothetical protein SAMN05216464_10637 [Mucilaginibacter pineti]